MIKKGKNVTQKTVRSQRTSDNDADDKRGIKNRASYFDNDPDDMPRTRSGGTKNSGKKK